MAILAQRLREYIAACFTGLWVQSFEHEDALAEIARLCRKERWSLATWDIDRGLRLPFSGLPATADAPAPATSGGDPLAAIKAINALARPDDSSHSVLLVMVNLHRFLGSAEIVQALAHQVEAGKQNRTFILVLSPIVQLPVELERLFTVVEHDLPDRRQLEEIARGVATEEGELPDAAGLGTVLDAAAGLTRYEAENAFSLALVRKQKITPDAVWEQKTQMLKKSGLLDLHRGRETFADLGGLDALKAFFLKALRPRPRSDPRSNPRSNFCRPRGVLLLSPPGCGKSQFCKALAAERQWLQRHLPLVR
jgi:hypothetical protein